MEVQNKKKEKYYTEGNNNFCELKENSNENKNNDINNNKKNNNYITPFPVPGYENDDNLWEFVCDLNSEDPLDKFLDKNSTRENNSYTGIKYLYNKKKN